MAEKLLDRKLARIRSGLYQPQDFVIADAKDGDMAFGVTAPGPKAGGGWKTKSQYLEAMKSMSKSGLVDIMLMSASSAETLSNDGLFGDSLVTPAVRLNDTTDIWMARGSRYRQFPSVPFASADIESVRSFCNLGLYSMTFSNDLQSDLASLNAYRAFRMIAREAEFQHFLEVFNPANDIGIKADEIGHYINDMIIKSVAGVTTVTAPLFLKIQFNGAASMSDLCRYDIDNLIVGILGGAAGTTRDTFELAHQAEQAGCRVALFGRKINLAEAPLELVRLMRETIEQKTTPDAAVVSYHAYLGENEITPQRGLKEDRQITDPVLRQ
ncbi:MAG: hypothetical protein V3U76_04795 [Granulosicoccus sp.]